MLLFQKRFHAGLVDGSITLTFRAWQKPLVKPGGRYRCHPIGVLEVDAIDRVRVRDVTEDEARAAGFDDRDALLAYLGEATPIGATTELFRVRLHHGGDGDRVAGALDDRLSAADVATLAEKVRRLDERAETPWVRETLRLIARQPRVAASKLAAKLGRETAPFKADVVKLKKLGLTQSFEVGYELTPRGATFLRRWRTR